MLQTMLTEHDVGRPDDAGICYVPLAVGYGAYCATGWHSYRESGCDNYATSVNPADSRINTLSGKFWEEYEKHHTAVFVRTG